MWVFEPDGSGSHGIGDEPEDAVIDGLGEDIAFSTDEVTTDEEEIVVRDLRGNVLGWCHWEE